MEELQNKAANNKAKFITHCPNNTKHTHFCPGMPLISVLKESSNNTSEKLHLAKLTLVQRNEWKKQKKQYRKPWISCFSML